MVVLEFYGVITTVGIKLRGGSRGTKEAVNDIMFVTPCCRTSNIIRGKQQIFQM